MHDLLLKYYSINNKDTLLGLYFPSVLVEIIVAYIFDAEHLDEAFIQDEEQKAQWAVDDGECDGIDSTSNKPDSRNWGQDT